jgi:tetratricopeptide (TPR) repeat protein
MADLEHRDLLHAEPRSTLPGEAAFSFKHVLIRDAAYDSLPRQQRRALHRAAGEWLRAAAGERVGDFSDQLAHHMVESEQPERALQFFATAAERSRRAASHVREAALLAEALAVAATLGRPAVVAELHAQRGTAFSRLARWQEAREELEAALAGLPTDTDEGLRRRAEVHCDLSTASFWLFDTEAIGDHARKALALAEQIGARDVQLAARAQLTNADSSTGQVDAVLAGGQRLIEDAAAWGIEPPYERLGTYSLQLYLTGRWEPASRWRATRCARDGAR